MIETSKTQEMQETQNQRRSPNFEEDGQWFLVRCFTCEPNRGRENYLPAVATGRCAWCGDTVRSGQLDNR